VNTTAYEAFCFPRKRPARCALRPERGLVVRSRVLECGCVPLNCGDVVVWIAPWARRVAFANRSLMMIMETP